MNQQYIQKLKYRNIKPTAIRLLILKTMTESDNALSMSDIESKVDTLDKSTISRTINLFLNHKLVHSIDDGSGAIKYAVCGDECSCAIADEHIHFSCTKCHKTFCFKGLHIPTVTLPKGFIGQQANFVLKGICEDCSKKTSSL